MLRAKAVRKAVKVIEILLGDDEQDRNENDYKQENLERKQEDPNVCEEVNIFTLFT